MASIKTPEAILSYVNLFTPRAASDDAEPQYSVTLVFTEETDITDLKKAALEIARERWGEKLAGAELQVLQTQHGPANFLTTPGGLSIRLPWRDHPDDVEQKGYPEGSTFFNVRSKNPPGVVSRIPDPSNDNKPAQIVSLSGDVRMKDGTVVPGAREVYSGVIGKALLSGFAYDVSGNKGVSFGLQGVQIIEDGERLDGRANAEDEFDADMEAAADLSDLTGENQDGEEEEGVLADAATAAQEAAAQEDDDLSDLIG